MLHVIGIPLLAGSRYQVFRLYIIIGIRLTAITDSSYEHVPWDTAITCTHIVILYSTVHLR